MRKQPTISAPTTVNTLQPEGIITQVREYELITPLFGGGVVPGENDTLTLIRGSEIRGNLRFWWRTCRSGQSNGDLAALKKKEDEIWGAAYKKEEEASKSVQTVQISVKILKAGNPVQPFGAKETKTKKKRSIPNKASGVHEYAAFPLQRTDEELNRNVPPPQREVLKNVSFQLTISFTKEYAAELEAALWAWETFGGIGARTRRGFGALRLLKINNENYNRYPPSDGVESWLKEELSKHLAPGKTPNNLPHLSTSVSFKVTRSYENASQAWDTLIEQLYKFRQYGRPGRSLWPEADAIYEYSQNGSTQSKFPRAAFGLPIIFHFKDNIPLDHTVQGAKKDFDRLSSPLILRPLPCKDNKVVGVALLLEGPSTPPKGLSLIAKGDTQSYSIESSLTPSEAQAIPVLNGETDVLKAFMNYLERNTQ